MITHPQRRPLARSAFDLVLGQVATTALAIVVTGMIGRALGPADFGVWYLLTTVANFAYVFVDWGYGPYIIREVARHPERAGDLTGSVLAVRAATVAVVCGPAVAITWALGYPPRTQALAAVTIACWLPIFLATSCTWTFRGRERMDFEATVNVALKAAMLVTTAALLATGARLAGVIVAQGMAGVVALAVSALLYRRLRVAPMRVVISTARELVREAAPIFTMALAITLQPSIDANLLSKLTPPQAVGWYGAALAFSGTLIAPAVILAGTVFPRLSQVATDRDQFARIVRAALRPIMAVAMLGTVGTYLFAEVAIALVYKQAAYEPAAVILRMFSPALFLISVDIFLGLAILATGKIASLARAKIAMLLMTTALELFLIRFFQTRYGNGGIGVMLSFTIGELGLCIVATRLIPRGVLNIDVVADLARIVVAGTATLLLISSLPIVTPFVRIPATILVYGLCVVVSGVAKPGDTEHLAALLRRRKAPVLGPSVAEQLT